jgi:phenylacetate-CoA ligase
MTGQLESWHWPPRYDGYRPADDEQYWFPHRETMDPEQRNEHILARIRQLMEYAYPRSDLYRRKWDDAGIQAQDVRSLEDFESVPPVTKEELRRDQEANPPFGSYLCVEEGDVHHVHGTSGTTGRPAAFGISRRDWEAIANAHARVMWGMGVRPSDVVFVAAFFSLYMGSWGAMLGAERLGATTFPFGAGAPGQTRRAVRWMRELQPTVLYGTPSYALYLAEVAEEEGVDPREFGLRTMFFSGEPGASVPPIRGRIEEVYGAQVYDSGSMAEVSPWMNLAETTGRVGMLCWQDLVYTEITDPETYRRVPYGDEGTPVYTTLERTSQPMIRLLSNDLTRWEAPTSPCGRTYPILPKGIYGRIDDMFTVRGENIYPSAIDEVAMELPNYGGEHRVIISRDDSMDELTVKVEYDDDLDASGEQAIERWRQRAESELATALGVRTNVLPQPPGTFDRTQMKARRIVDDRGLWKQTVEAGAT